MHSVLLPENLRHIYVIVFVSNSPGVERHAMYMFKGAKLGGAHLHRTTTFCALPQNYIIYMCCNFSALPKLAYVSAPPL